MSQAEALKTLIQSKKWMTSEEIAAIIKISQGSTSLNLSKLHKQGLVKKKVGRKKHFPIFLWKIK